MYDRFNRKITYLRISVTDRCNLRCTYCMPATGVIPKKHEDILSFEEVLQVVKTGVGLGITKVRLTGGEPLVRKGIVSFIQRLGHIAGIEDVGLTTNGTLLPLMAKDLKKAGLKRVNISLDTLDPEKYREITRIGRLEDALKGVDAAIEAGLYPIKINFVRIPGKNKEDEQPVMQFCKEKGLQLRFIRQMSLDTGEFYPVEGGDGGRCLVCNRLRLTADGYIKPCLFSDYRFSVRESGIKEAFIQAMHNKPVKGYRATGHKFYSIGG